MSETSAGPGTLSGVLPELYRDEMLEEPSFGDAAQGNGLRLFQSSIALEE